MARISGFTCLTGGAIDFRNKVGASILAPEPAMVVVCDFAVYIIRLTESLEDLTGIP
jgi:hypothetical protein